MRPAVVVLLLGAAACGRTVGDGREGGADTPAPAAAIRSVLAQDDSLGRLRNRLSMDTTLNTAVDRYVAGLDQLDLSACPPDFAAALRAHRDAWAAAKPVLARYDTLRGEMHELFERIRTASGAESQALAAVEAAIWETWAAVETAAARYTAPGDRPGH